MVRILRQIGTKKTENKTSATRRFAGDEDGAVFTIFVLLGILVIFATTGIGVDLMNYERDRANLQSTLDRAVLAAADLDQTLPPRDVVEAYLDKAGLADKLKTVSVQESFGSRTVSATAEAVVDTHFMTFSGIHSLNAVAASTAEESIGNVEISLILDISGSMNKFSSSGGKSKLALLQDAATEFVTLMLASEDKAKQNISISIIPYATQVNAGKDLLDQFTNVTDEHQYSHCVNFIPEQYSDSDIMRNDRLERTGHFDPWTHSEGSILMPVCPVRAGSAITPVTDQLNDLKAQIAALTAQGNTSIDIGMKWGVALLDPSMRGIVSDLAGDDYNIVPDHFVGRPTDYDSDILKIAIVMTDGKNTNQYMLNPSLRDGPSDVWYNPDSEEIYDWGQETVTSTNNKKVWVSETGQIEGEYSTYHSQGKNIKYYWSQREEWSNHPYGNPKPENATNEEPGTAVRLTYPELFNRASLQFVSDYVFDWAANARAEWTSKAYSKVETAAKNQRTKHICNAAKNQGIIVYGIAFEAPRSGYDTIKDCASSDSHVYDVQGLDLEKAFESIASSIKKLRLTQ